jgi:hypothetical protein
MHEKALHGVEFKDAGNGAVEAVFATLGVRDLDSDVTLKGAFEEGAPVRISAYNHASWEGALPIGKGTIHEEGDKAVFRGEFFKTQAAQDTREALKGLGEMAEWSYGFDVKDSESGEHEGKSVRFLKSLKVYEVSPVLLGAAGPGRTGTIDVKRTFSAEDRHRMAGNGQAMADGSFPIANVQDLRNAIQAIGRAKDPVAARRHIMRRARALNATNLIPDDWTKAQSGFVAAIRGAIPVHETGVVSQRWDGAGTVKALYDDARPSELRTVYAWVSPEGDPEVKSSYRFPHHHGIGGPANIRACLAGIAVLNGARDGAGIPEGDRKAAYDHLAAHLMDADREPPQLRTADGETKKQRFGDEASTVLANLSGLIDRATDVMALRTRKGRGMSPATADLLLWIGDDLARLKSLLEHPIQDDEPQPSDDEIAAALMAAVARVHGI